VNEDEPTVHEEVDTDAIDRIEARVERSLVKAMGTQAGFQGMNKTVAYVFCAGMAVMQVVIMAAFVIDANDRSNRRGDTARHQEYVERQLIGQSCLLMAPNAAGERTVADAARCEVEYIPRPPRGD